MTEDMVNIPREPVTEAELAQWFTMKQQLTELKAAESALRMRIFRYYFPEPREGTNNFTLPDGYVLKATYPYERKVDTAVFKNMGEQFAEAGIFADTIVRFVPELVKSEYNKLTEYQAFVFDQCLVLKPGSPQLTIAAPAKRKSNG